MSLSLIQQVFHLASQEENGWDLKQGDSTSFYARYQNLPGSIRFEEAKFLQNIPVLCIELVDKTLNGEFEKISLSFASMVLAYWLQLENNVGFILCSKEFYISRLNLSGNNSRKLKNQELNFFVSSDVTFLDGYSYGIPNNLFTEVTEIIKQHESLIYRKKHTDSYDLFQINTTNLYVADDTLQFVYSFDKDVIFVEITSNFNKGLKRQRSANQTLNELLQTWYKMQSFKWLMSTRLLFDSVNTFVWNFLRNEMNFEHSTELLRNAIENGLEFYEVDQLFHYINTFDLDLKNEKQIKNEHYGWFIHKDDGTIQVHLSETTYTLKITKNYMSVEKNNIKENQNEQHLN